MVVILRSTFGLLVLYTLWSIVIASENARILSPEFRNVTYYSTVRLCHAATGFYLHSHPVMYGGGSGQQSITGFKDADDPNDDFSVLAGFGKSPVFRGGVIPCGSVIQLFHTSSRKYLHSHLQFESPLSKRQEVSCFDGENEENNWIVDCAAGGFWTRDQPIKLKHSITSKYLTMVKSNVYNNLIQGQLEVYCDKLATSSAQSSQNWVSSEGIYYSNVRDEL
jgi:dolichyl-phosphate-mannose--protein O-mannosyl transferase